MLTFSSSVIAKPLAQGVASTAALSIGRMVSGRLIVNPAGATPWHRSTTALGSTPSTRFSTAATAAVSTPCSTPSLWGMVAVTAVALLTVSFLNPLMDANPALFWHEQWQRRRFPGGRPPPRHDHYHRCVWIIGASSGIGEELAYQLAASGTVRQLILSSRQVPRLEAVAERCRQQMPVPHTRDASIATPVTACQVTVLPVNVTAGAASWEQIVRKVRDLTQATGGLDVVILNAGVGHLSPALATSSSTVEQVLQTTAHWPMILTPLLFQHDLFDLRHSPDQSGATNNMNNNSGRIPHLVVTSSIAARLPVPLAAVYAASKQALHGYFRSLSTECGDRLRIDLLCPGPVDTPFHQHRAQSLEESAPNHHHRLGEVASVASKDNSLRPQRTDDEDQLAAKPPSSSRGLKMSVQRCVQLYRSAMSMHRQRDHRPRPGLYEHWIVGPPTLTALYLQALCPAGLHQVLRRWIGPQRISLWRQGADLYDRSSWTSRPGK